VTYILFLGFFLGLSDNAFQKNNLYIGFTFWYFASTVISEGSISVSYEKQTGTFEQLLIKPLNILYLLSIRTIIWFGFTLLKVIVLFLIISISIQYVIPFDLKVIPILIITLFGLYGFGMLLSASTLIFTKTASFESIISYILLFFTGGIIPITQLPKGVAIVAQFLPLTKGVEISQALLAGIEILPVDFMLLLINSFIYFLIGMIVFKMCYKKSQEHGLNSEY
jgi:ABC-2 type transport system permease protein